MATEKQLIMAEELTTESAAYVPEYGVTPLYEPRPNQPEWYVDDELNKLLTQRGILLEVLWADALKRFPGDDMQQLGLRELMDFDQAYVVLSGALRINPRQGPLDRAIGYFASKMSDVDRHAWGKSLLSDPEVASRVLEMYDNMGEEGLLELALNDMQTTKPHRFGKREGLPEGPSLTIPFKANMMPHRDGPLITPLDCIDGYLSQGFMLRYPHVGKAVYDAAVKGNRQSVIPVPVSTSAEDGFFRTEPYMGQGNAPAIQTLEIYNPRTVAALRLLPVLDPQAVFMELNGLNGQIYRRAAELPDVQRAQIVYPQT